MKHKQISKTKESPFSRIMLLLRPKLYVSYLQYVRLMSLLNLCIRCTCADKESFVQLLSRFFFLILIDEGRESPHTTISGPSSARQRNAI